MVTTPPKPSGTTKPSGVFCGYIISGGGFLRNLRTGGIISGSNKLSDLGPKRAFFRADGVPFVADLASDKMFRMAGDNLSEIDG